MENRNYYTFKRACLNWREFANAEKEIVDEDLTYSEAIEQCQEYNSNLSELEKENGTKMELTTMD